MKLYELKKEYNNNINRLKKADNYFKDNPDKFQVTVVGTVFSADNKITDEYYKIVRELSDLQDKYLNIVGAEMKEENKINGF